jgi:hypothetical protein
MLSRAVCLGLVLTGPPVLAGSAVAISSPPEPQQRPARDAGTASVEAPTAKVRGRVTAGSTGQPLRRVRVTLNGPKTLSTVTDPSGRFEISQVPAGSYTVSASRAGYLTARFGQPGQPEQPIDITKDEIVDGVNVALFRGSAVSGRIVDDRGEPYEGVRVEVLHLQYVRGHRVAVAAVPASLTNDIGEYRVGGLQAGSYTIRASSTDNWEGDDGTTHVYAITYFPGTAAADQSRTLTLAREQELTGLDFQLIPGNAGRVVGTVTDAAGAPIASQVVNLDRISRTTNGALQSAGFGGTSTSDANGTFEIGKLPPGEYKAYTGATTSRASADVMLGDGDTRMIALALRRAPEVSGSVDSADEPFPAAARAALRVIALPANPERILPAWGEPGPAPVANGRFTLNNLNGSYVLRVQGLPDEWAVKAVLQGGRDITDAPLSITPGMTDLSDVRILLTRKTAAIDGDVRGAPGTGSRATVVVFAEDSGRWGAGSRFVKAVPCSAKGHFEIKGLPAGAYSIAARENIEDGAWEDSDFLRGLVDQSVRVTLTTTSHETIILAPERPR